MGMPKNAVKKYDVIIVGSGSAGIFAARELALKSGLKVLLLDKGYPLEKRRRLPHGGRDDPPESLRQLGP